MMDGTISNWGYRIWILYLTLGWTHSLLLLTDLPTPSFIIDVDVLHQRHPQSHTKSTALPRFLLRKYNTIVSPIPLTNAHHNLSSLQGEAPYIADFSNPGRALGYLHAKVIKVKKDDESFLDSTFIAELDLKPFMCRDLDFVSKDTTNCCWARLVQGLSNDRVGTYYWARSTGLGCSMMAHGVLFGDKSFDTGILR